MKYILTQVQDYDYNDCEVDEIKVTKSNIGDIEDLIEFTRQFIIAVGYTEKQYLDYVKQNYLKHRATLACGWYS